MERNIKICTSIEQSKKLIELGIDVNTADMCRTNHLFNDFTSSWRIESTPPQKYKNLLDRFGVKGYLIEPAWSLSALLGLMPKLYEFENDPDDGGCQPNLCKGWDNNKWHIVYRSSIYITEWYDNPLDAAYELVCWLKENKKI